jgi:methyl-accepting chemotaxis protein/NO-binding membrane sensor protein with MHYT domain
MLGNIDGAVAGYDWRLLLVVATLALSSAVGLIRFFHSARTGNGRTRLFAVAFSGLNAGCGIWAAEFGCLIGQGAGNGGSYDTASTLLALIIAIAIPTSGLAMATYRSALTTAGGAIIGIGIAATHYIALHAASIPVRIVYPSLLAGAALTAAILGAIVLRLAARHDSWRWFASSAAAFVLAILVHQFAAAEAAEFYGSPSPSADAVLSPSSIVLSMVALTTILGIVNVLTARALDSYGQRLTHALDNLHVGLLIFDADEKILVCNAPYKRMYGIPDHVVRPGHGSLTSMLDYRVSNGTFRENREQYLINLRSALSTSSSTHREPKLADGRMLSVSTHPMAGGGWVAIHENISALRHAEEERAKMLTRDQRRIEIEEAISSFRTRVETVLKTVRESSVSMSHVANALLVSSNQTSVSAKAALDSSQGASAGSAAAAAATNELNRAIAEISGQLNRTANTVRAGVSKANATSEQTAILAEAAQKIGDVSNLIQTIAKQTNLLALNATIEAARAGESGRGFAIVASEVKSLSLKTAKATSEIAQQISSVQSSTAQVVDAIAEIRMQMQEIDAHSSEAASAVAKQDEASREISRSVAGAAEETSKVSSVLGHVVTDTDMNHRSAQTVLGASSALEQAVLGFREEVDALLMKVSKAANEPIPAAA